MPISECTMLSVHQLLLALEGGRASLEQAIEGALGRIPEAFHHIRKLWATDQDAFCNHLLRLDVAGTTVLPWEYPTILFANMRSFALPCRDQFSAISLMTNCEAQPSSG